MIKKFSRTFISFMGYGRGSAIWHFHFYDLLPSLAVFGDMVATCRQQLNHFGSPWGYSVDLAAGRI